MSEPFRAGLLGCGFEVGPFDVPVCDEGKCVKPHPRFDRLAIRAVERKEVVRRIVLSAELWRRETCAPLGGPVLGQGTDVRFYQG